MTALLSRLGDKILGNVLAEKPAAACSTMTGKSCGPCTAYACTVNCAFVYHAYETDCYGRCTYVATVCACPPN